MNSYDLYQLRLRATFVKVAKVIWGAFLRVFTPKGSTPEFFSKRNRCHDLYHLYLLYLRALRKKESIMRSIRDSQNFRPAPG
jgi:hypothetical protein